MYAAQTNCRGVAGADRKNIVWEFPAKGDGFPQESWLRRRIPPEFFRTAACHASTKDFKAAYSSANDQAPDNSAGGFSY